MSSLQRLVITAGGTTDDFKSECPMAVGGQDAANNFVSYLSGVMSGTGANGALLSWQVGAVQATATMTVAAGGSANDETCSIANVTFTAKTSGATGNQFNINADEEVQAANMAAAFNASSNLAGKVTASVAGAVVTLTSVVPGLVGNGIQVSDALANVTTAAFANGSDGTSYSQDFS